MKSVIVQGAFKAYGSGNLKEIVLNGLNMSVNCGSIYALIGASGCGKTTLLSSIVGMKSLNSGEIYVLGEKLKPKQIPEACLHIGFMPQEVALHDEFTVEETLDFFGNIYQMDNQLLKERKIMLKNLLELPPEDRLVVDCSGGEQRRISLAACLIHDPRLIILDEPTVGLDPLLREKIWNFMIHMTRTKNISIIITTHYIEEAKHADRCGLMRGGVLLAEGSPRAILQQHNCDSLEDAFYNLCASREISKDMKIDEDNVKDIVVDETPREKLMKRTYFHKNTIKALIFKSYVQIFRQPMIILTTLLFLFGAILFYLSVGKNPTTLSLGIVNGEIQKFDECRNSSLITAVPNYDAETCELNRISCRFLNAIEDNFGEKIFYENFEDAYIDAKKGKIIMFLHFSSNFSQATQEMLSVDKPAFNDDLLLDREIGVYMDKSDLFTSTHLQKFLYEEYQEYSMKLMKDCNFSDNMLISPIQFQKPIYGEMEFNLRSYSGPLMFLNLFSLSFVVSTILTFIDERKKGLWKRTFLSGVDISELMFAHSILQVFLGAVTIFVFIHLMMYLYPRTADVNYFLLIIYFTIFGLFGLLLGILGGASTNDYSSAAHLGNFIAFAMANLSGLMWPLEGIQKHVRVFLKYCFPTVIPFASFSDLVQKGYGFSDKSIWIGLLTISGWCILLVLLNTIILKKKKFS